MKFSTIKMAVLSLIVAAAAAVTLQPNEAYAVNTNVNELMEYYDLNNTALLPENNLNRCRRAYRECVVECQNNHPAGSDERKNCIRGENNNESCDAEFDECVSRDRTLREFENEQTGSF